MVDTLEPYNKALKGLQDDIPKFLQKVLKDRSDEVIAILRDEQLAEGENAEGKVVGKYKKETEDWARFDRELSGGKVPIKDKEKGRPYNFEWTGGLFSDMTLFFDDIESFSLFSKDEKATVLQKKYGDIFTLTEKNNKRVNEEILLPALNDYIEKRLTL